MSDSNDTATKDATRQRARKRAGSGGADAADGSSRPDGGSSSDGSSNRGSSSQKGSGGGDKGKRGGRNKRRRGRRRGNRKRQNVGFWGDAEKLPDPDSTVRITDDPAAVPRSLGHPPLPGNERMAQNYFELVYTRAVTMAGAVAAAGGLIEPDDLTDEFGEEHDGA